ITPLLRPFALAATLGIGMLASASAAEYSSIDAQASRIAFGYSQRNVKMDGAFSQIQATEFSFDPANPEAAKVAIQDRLTRIGAGDHEADTELEKGGWLDGADHA